MSHWVQHISGQGEKWEVVFEDEVEFEVKAKVETTGRHWLPTSEYVKCEPPERWVELSVHPMDSLFYQTSMDDRELRTRWTIHTDWERVGLLEPGYKWQLINNTFKILKKVLDNSAKP